MKNDRMQIGVSIDAISHIENDLFRLRLIPDFDSKFFMPAHTRHVLVKAELLEPQFLAWVNSRQFIGQDNFRLDDTSGSVAQGGYYILSKSDFQNISTSKEPLILNRENDMFEGKKTESPYNELGIRGERVLEIEENVPLEISNDSGIGNSTYLYGLYVGQGDTLLLITSNKNAYLIDVNFCNRNFDKKVKEIKAILNMHGMSEVQIKGLIITHKHADHMRGAYALIDTGAFQFENLFINLDYPHPTSIVEKFFNSATSIPVWINLNKPSYLVEGQTRICFKNPDKATRLAPDINDSSIVMCVQHGKNHIYLTGDACASVLAGAFACSKLGLASEKVLKVSHHGSRTGTDDALINMLTPAKAFLSAGNSRTYGHPHNECLDVLKRHPVNYLISKVTRRTVEYKCDGVKITQRII